ncbi:SHOCT domain-containing protein [Candidatus Pelagibacter sp.]|nr:SHOCT domain-containing protein [Candidatus Pelagibacter sp.]
MSDELLKLSELYQSGTLTEEEFEKAKKENSRRLIFFH